MEIGDTADVPGWSHTIITRQLPNLASPERGVAATPHSGSAGLNFIQLPAFRLDKGGNRFRGKKRFRTAYAFSERVEALFGGDIDSNRERSAHVWSSVIECVHPGTEGSTEAGRAV